MNQGQRLSETAFHYPGKKAEAVLRRGIVVVAAAVFTGLVTSLTGAVLELSSGFLADVRHGVCVVRYPGDTRPLWQTTLSGNWRPYDRTRCCGGSPSVDHTTEECRAPSIIKHSIHKRFAVSLPSFPAFGHAANSSNLGHGSTKKPFHLPRNAASRAEHLQALVGADARRVRSHVSHLFEPDPSEPWAEEQSRRSFSFAEEAIKAASLFESSGEESAVNFGVVQTQSESAGGMDPMYEWVPWERLLHGRGSAVAIYVLGSAVLALLASLLTSCYPAARGSGIPEVKAHVAGFHLPVSFEMQTLVSKVGALALCVGAGLAVGREGPMIHIGACWGSVMAAPTLRILRALEPSSAVTVDTELASAGAAAGVSAAFGAPLAGVLFAVEELSTARPLRHDTMLGAFGAAVAAALALRWLDLAGTHRLTLFEVDYRQAWAPWETIPFCFLGALGGLLGGAFVLLNEAVSRRRRSAFQEGRLLWFLPRRFDNFCRRFCGTGGSTGLILEVAVLAILTSISNYPFPLTRILQNDGIIALFSRCPSESYGAIPFDPLGLCSTISTNGDTATGRLLRTLTGVAALRLFQTAATFGALVPAGLFVPSLFIGGCVGRAVGSLLQCFGLPGDVEGSLVEPGIYAMVGAGAMLAGVSRLTISLVVALFELTGGLTYVVPFMIAVLIAKWTGDSITNGRSIYDVHALLNGFAKVEQPENFTVPGALLRDLCPAGLGADDAEDPGAERDCRDKEFAGCEIVKVREDCPVITAFCLFRERPKVSALALVPVQHVSQWVQLPQTLSAGRFVTRELFMSRLRNHLCPSLANLQHSGAGYAGKLLEALPPTAPPPIKMATSHES